MADRTFLEDIGTPYSTNAIGSTRVWEVRHLRNDPTLPPLIYVVETEVGQQFLLGRGVSGRPKFNMIRYIASSFVEVFFEQLRGKELSQYLILRGAYPFDLQYAMGSIPPYDSILLPTDFIKLQRVLNREGTDWEVQPHNFIEEYRGDTWLVPETVIASGSTIAFFLKHGFARHLPRQVYIFTACGSLDGIRRIFQQCQEKGVELIPVFSQSIFEVSKIGNLPGLPFTGLSVISTGSMTTKEFYEKAFQRYQGTRMCCVGDIRESLEDPLQYSIHTLWEMKILGLDPNKEDWNTWTVDIRDKVFQKNVSEFNPDLADYFNDAWK